MQQTKTFQKAETVTPDMVKDLLNSLEQENQIPRNIKKIKRSREAFIERITKGTAYVYLSGNYRITGGTLRSDFKCIALQLRTCIRDKWNPNFEYPENVVCGYMLNLQAVEDGFEQIAEAINKR